MIEEFDREPLTVLEHLKWQRNQTYKELTVDFLAVAKELGEDATITPRHFARLARSERTDSRTHPATCRVLQVMFGRSIDELLQSWVKANELGALFPPGAQLPTACDIGGAVSPAEQIALRTDQEGNVWAQINRRTFLISSAAIAAVAGGNRLVPQASAAAAVEDSFGFANALTGRWPGVRVSRPVPDYGVDWNVLVPGGRSMIGSSAAVQVHPAQVVDGRVLGSLDDPRRTAEFRRGPGRRMLVGADVDADRPRYYLFEDQGTNGQQGFTAPTAYELDDLTYGILWATANLDDALQDNDQALAETRADLTAYEQLSASAVSREAAPGLNPVGHMWLGSDFCAQHILRSLPQLPSVPTFWTREQRGEEASPWLLFGHKYEYLRQTMNLIGSPVVRAFCIPESAVQESPRHERTLLFLAIALMESLGIHTQVTAEPDYGNVEGFVVAPHQQTIIANWVRGDGMWHVDCTNRASLVRTFTDVAAAVGDSSVIAGGTPVARLRALADYLDLDWIWVTTRCADLAKAGTAGMIRTRSRMVSATGLDAACTFVGALPTGA